MGSRLWCSECDTMKPFLMYRSGYFKKDGETVKRCKDCGFLRTESVRRVNRSLIRHKPTGRTMRDLEQENFFEDGDGE